MKLGLIGNCQLEVLGLLIQGNPSACGGVELAYNTPLYKLNEKKITDLFFALDQCDLILGQYYGPEWGRLCTENLAHYFDIQVLPTLESKVSYPQLGYWPERTLPDGLVYIDYRFLHLYLAGSPLQHAVQHYTEISLDQVAITQTITQERDRYRELFDSGAVTVDYSDIFFELIKQNTESYSTLSHPNNTHMSFLFKHMMKSCGVEDNFTLNGPEVLENHRVPKLGSQETLYYMMRPASLNLAARIYYEFFSSQQTKVLEDAFKASNYARLLHRT